MQTSKKILILGGEGFIGKNLSESFSTKFDCYSLDLCRSVFKSKDRNFIQKDPYEAKISGKYDIVIHLIDRKESLEDLEKIELRLIKNLASVSFSHFIFFSSAAVNADPESDYAKRKMLLEKLFIKTYGPKKTTILRLYNTYGPYQLPNRQGGLIANILTSYLLGRTINIKNVKAKRDFIYSKDIAILVERVINNGSIGVNDLSTNTLTPIKKVIELVEEKVIFDKLKIMDLNQPENLQIEAGKSMLHRNILFTPMEQSLKETLKFYSSNLKIIEKLYE